MSGFKALNGASPKSTGSPTITVDTSSQIEQHHFRQNAHTAQQTPISGSGKPEGWTIDRKSMQSGDYQSLDSSHKRKRSGSLEAKRESYIQEKTPDTATATTSAQGRYIYGSQQERRPLDEGREKSSWRNSQEREDRQRSERRAESTTSTQGPTDEQAGEASQQAGGHGDHSDYRGQSSDADDPPNSAYPYGSDSRQDPMLQHDPKKRKRNFSNRTKTGCLTCRKRKKKCDEEKPECTNCVRGGFLCAGYPPQRGPGWQKPENKSPAVPLESKDPSYVPPGAYGMPQPGSYGNQSPYHAPSSKRDSISHYRGQALRIDPPQGRPLTTDDDRPTASTLPSASVGSPDNKLSAMPYTPANMFPTPVSANTQPPPSFGDRMAKEYQRVPPLHDLTRTDPDPASKSNHLPQINILHARPSSPPLHSSTQSSNAQVAAQLALSHSPYPQRRTQKEEMLSGRNYYPFDKELCLERERCATACWRFNHLSSPPTHGVSTEERARLFLEILQPRDPIRISPNEISPVSNVGRVGRHVAVETPFICDYGYNITIGNLVSIGRNCTINDVCEVKIGNNCVLGPNVNIYTAVLPIDPKKRQGSQGPQQGRPVTIEEDCWIGGGATILPGRTIGKGSTVGAGSIVTKDVPPFTIVAGNPARVLRGIAS